MKKRLVYVLISIVTFFIGFGSVYILERSFDQFINSTKNNLLQTVGKKEVKPLYEIHGKEMTKTSVAVWDWDRPGSIAFPLDETLTHKNLFSYCNDFKLSYKKTRNDLFPHSGLPIPVWYFDSDLSKNFTSNRDSFFIDRFTCKFCELKEHEWLIDKGHRPSCNN